MNPIRIHISCPDCGWLNDSWLNEPSDVPFDCKRCGTHYSVQDFYEEHQQKLMAQKHNTAKADLSGEENDNPTNS